MDYFYDFAAKAFLVDGIHVIPEEAIPVREEEYKFLVNGRAKGRDIILMGGTLTLTPPRPSIYHVWNTNAWVIDDDKKNELITLKQQQFIKAIDDKATDIYSNWTRFESEYKARKEAAESYKAASYQGEVSRYITSFAIPAGISNQAATDLILMQAAGLQKLQDELAAQRMRKYELRRPDLSDEQMQTIYDDIIQQMDKLAEAYNNG